MSLDSQAENKSFKDKFDFPYDLLCDESGDMSAAFGAADAGAKYASRVSVLVAPDGKVAAVYSTVKPDAHPDEVLQTLQSLS